MAALSTQARAEVSAEFQRHLSAERERLGLTKPELQAALNALDDFLVANAATINSSIPLPARTILTASQKARLMMFVIRRRYVDGA